jgi:uncharacterized protein DUF4337
MAGPHENLEHAEHAQHAAHSGGENNKKIALIISVLALCLAFSETFGKSAQTNALNLQIEASNLWNFMQAKTIRRTFTIVQGEAAAIEAATTTDEIRKAALAKQMAEWKKTADRYRSEPEAGGGKGEGTVELMRRALEKEKERDLQFNKYHNFEFASAAFQIGIVLASAAVITSIIGLAYAAICVGLVGMVLTGAGLFAPEVLHHVMHWFEALFAGGGHH